MDLILSPDELVQVTGYVQTSAQIRWLRAQNWRFHLDGRGRPVVDREYYRQQMGVLSAAPGKSAPTEPNWENLQ
jgi:hypothetical protein